MFNGKHVIYFYWVFSLLYHFLQISTTLKQIKEKKPIEYQNAKKKQTKKTVNHCEANTCT